MPTVPAENGFSEIAFRENTKVLNNPTEAEVINAILNSSDDVMITGQAPVITRPLEPPVSGGRTIASMDERLIVDIADTSRVELWKFSPTYVWDYIHLIGLGGVQVKQANKTAGINVRCNGQANRGINDILVEDCYFKGLDAPMGFVDDYARTSGSNDNGRITVRVRRNIMLDTIGSDSHAVPLYLEGTRDGTFVEENTFHKAGWVDNRNTQCLNPDRPNELEANAREHCIYCQTINQKINLYNNFFGEPSANGYQIRAGGDSIGNVLWRCPVGGWHNNRAGQRIIRNVHIDQVDINDVESNAGRGHGFFVSGGGGNNQFIENIVARKHGSLKSRPAIEAYGSDTVVKNHVYDWKRGEISGGDPNKSYGNVVDNSEGAGDFLPEITDSMLQVWRNRGRREWDVKKTHIAYRNRVQELVFLRSD